MLIEQSDELLPGDILLKMAPGDGIQIFLVIGNTEGDKDGLYIINKQGRGRYLLRRDIINADLEDGKYMRLRYINGSSGTIAPVSDRLAQADNREGL